MSHWWVLINFFPLINVLSLGVIEDLRHIDKYDIDLPRIIVCGDQSSGKSSVLEAISRLNLPRDESTCTTFATELTLDHHDGVAVAVNILWEAANQEGEEFHPKDPSIKNLANTINEAKRIMVSRNGQTGRTFFKDTLHIKASNPAWPPLTLVDLPGLVQSGMDDRELETVREIISTHMAQPKTIILAVVSASHDVQNQGIMKLAQKYDPEGRRTMGIITKPDRVSSPQMEQKWIEMAMGKSAKYTCELGWHVVRNRDPAETECDFNERDRKEEDFFRYSAWKRTLREDQLGIDSLRVKLSKILEDHTRSALPGIIMELDRKLKTCQYNLKGLGLSRTTLEDRQIYLTGIAQSFYDVTKDAINAQYEGEFFDKGMDRNLYALIKAQNNEFVKWMYSWGHTYEEAGISTTRDLKAPIMVSSLQYLGAPEVISRADFISKIQHIQTKRGGHEFDGMFNPTHFKRLFQEQSRRWREIAQAHLDNVWATTRTFLLTAVHHAAGPSNDHTANALIFHVIEPAIELKREALFTKLEELLRPYETFPIMAHDPEFIHDREVLYERLHDKDKIVKHLAVGYGDETANVLSERMSSYGMAKPEYPSDSSQILDLMKLYYKNSLRTFINNIVSLAVYNCLVYQLQDLFGPLKVQEIARDNKQLLEALANEPEEIRRRRSSLEQEQQVLQEALNKCKKQFGNINMYIIQSDRLSDSSAMHPTVTILPPPSSSVTPSPSIRRSNASTQFSQTHSRASSTLSAASASTTQTAPSLEGSPTGQGKGLRHDRGLSSRSAGGARASRQILPNAEGI